MCKRRLAVSVQAIALISPFLVIRLLIAVISFFLFFDLLTAEFAPWYRIELTVQSENSQLVKVYYGNKRRSPAFSEKHALSSSVSASQAQQKLVFKHSPRTERLLRIDPGEQPGTMRLHSMVVFNSLSGETSYSAPELYEKLIPNDQIQRYELQENSILIVADGNDPFLTGSFELPLGYQLCILGLAMLFSCLVFLFSAGISSAASRRWWAQLKIISDMHSKAPAEGPNFQVLDGLRGLGAIFVLAEHSTQVFDGLGGVGVCLFFSLSGFLLMQPFLKDPSRITNTSYMSRFFQRRIKRILPAYSLYLFLIYFTSFRIDSFFRHLLFLEGDKHLWTMPQEMFFYLLLPAIFLLFYGAKKIGTWAAIVLLMGLIALADYGLFEVRIIHNTTYHIDIARNISIFLCGMLGAVLVKEIGDKAVRTGWHSRYFGLAGATILIAFALLNEGVFGTSIYALSYPFVFNILAVAVIICCLYSAGTLFHTLLCSRFLRAIGLVSFSFYIYHYVTVKWTKSMFELYLAHAPSDITLMFLAGALSYCIAAISYTLVERPFVRHKTVQLGGGTSRGTAAMVDTFSGR